MSIKDPISYGDWYWKQSVDASRLFDEGIEKAVSPFIKNVLNDVPELGELPSGMLNLMQGLAEPATPGLGATVASAAGEFAAETLHDICAPGMAILKRAINRGARETWLTGEQAVTLAQRNQITDDYFYLLNPWSEFQKWWSINPREFPLWNWLGKQKLTTLQVQDLFKRGFMNDSDMLGELARIGWPEYLRADVKDLSYSLPNSMLLVQGDLVKDVYPEIILSDISKGGIHPDYAQKYLDAVLTKPASQDLIAYQLRQDPELSTLEAELKKIGVHPDYTKVYKTLAYQIPPVADIITMSVREAFTPDIAAKFGQYEDFPDDLKTYAGMKGLSEDWAKRYWAAHWALPSPQQGFEMLHRGVISEGELNMLLRAQDVMPFWRDKLVQIAYRRLTRVDIRRMYREGVLGEGAVYESYLEHGYNEENARRMSLFTIRQTLSSLSKFTAADITKAYANGMISAGEANSLLQGIGIRPDSARYIVGTAEYKRQWAFTDDQIAGIRNLYKKRVYNENEARDKLSRLNLASGQIEVLMQQWFYEKVEELDATWTTAQTLKFLKRNLISAKRAERELYLNGYDKEHVAMYLKDSKWTKPKE